MGRFVPVTRVLFSAFLLLTLGLPGVAAPPGEVPGVGFSDGATLAWDVTVDADFYNVYRGDVSGLNGVPGRCHAFEIGATSYTTPQQPEHGEGYFYLVTAESTAEGEGTPGLDSSSSVRPLLGRCSPVMRTHVLDRLGYGWNEWARDQVESLGIDGYIQQQLAPRFINETDNVLLHAFLDPITPPNNIVPLVQHQIIRATYARRQLEQQYASFWANHFNTDWSKVTNFWQSRFPQCQAPGVPPQCDPDYPARAALEGTTILYDEIQAFRLQGFGGSFREILESSAFSPGMVIYLDTFYSTVGNPNENYPRELLELSTMGVNGGYTQQDVEQLARVFTGVSLCKKFEGLLELDDPCLPVYYDDDIPGAIVATFEEAQHDCDAKTLFADTPQEFTIPSTCFNPSQGIFDFNLALNAIVAHPSTARFISTKILQRFVTDEPTQATEKKLRGIFLTKKRIRQFLESL